MPLFKEIQKWMATVQKQHGLCMLSKEIVGIQDPGYKIIPDVFRERNKLTNRAFAKETMKQRALAGASQDDAKSNVGMVSSHLYDRKTHKRWLMRS